MVVGNLVGGADVGFESDENEVVLALSTGETLALERASKRELADRIFDEILKLRLSLHATHEA
jgi:phosphopantothenoylcysteine synthetase/decarboxylase